MSFNTVRRVLPLQPHYQQMKRNYYEEAKREGFRNYRSPWLPVAENNRHLLKAGDLVIDETGLEAPWLLGRGAVDIEDGKITGFDYIANKPELVWVNTNICNTSEYIECNPIKEQYSQYSQEMRDYLLQSERAGLPPTEEVVFPLFHETTLESARNILKNGLDYFTISCRHDAAVGNGFFSACQTIKGVKGKGNYRGAILKIMNTGNAKPTWIDRNEASRQRPMYFNFRKPIEQVGKYYSWKTIVSELGATAITTNQNVFIFDSLEQYAPVEIITDY